MKKLTLLLFSLLMTGLALQSCDNSKTYAEMLADESKSINAYIKNHNINVISTDQFLKQDTTTAENEYVLFYDGVYLHIDKKGGKIPENNAIMLTRFLEIDIASGDSILSNYYDNTSVDQFRYNVSGTSSYGLFFQDQNQKAYMLTSYGSAVPAGWLEPLKYVGDGAKIKVIVPSKKGHSIAQQYVTPYFYEIQYTIY